MPQDYQGLYVSIGRLLETAPDMSNPTLLSSPAVLQWTGRAHALVSEVDIFTDKMKFVAAVDRLSSRTYWQMGVNEMFVILYRALAHCEFHTPAAAGSFIPVGSSFDAFAAIAKLLKSATTEVLIVDPYLDETVLTDFAQAVPEGVPLLLLADQADHKQSLLPAAIRWVSQYGKSRPLSVRLAPPKTLHDRALFIDRLQAWTITQSFKDFAKRSPGEIVRADDTAALKIAAYGAIWVGSTVVA